MKLRFFISIMCLICYSQKTCAQELELGQFVKQDAMNPVLLPINTTTFFCPVRQENVFWEDKDIFNRTALVRDRKIHLLYRGDDEVGIYNGTSRVGLGLSTTGLEFERMTEPIFYPENDNVVQWEWEGGCEDPRIVEDEFGTYFMTYTAYDGTVARLLVASSNNLANWTKYGPVFKSAENGMYVDMWTKSGSIVTTLVGEKLIATKINEKYWMYWGDMNSIYLAHSDDLINWTPITGGGETDYDLVAVLKPRTGHFDSDTVTPRSQAVIGHDGIRLIYNSRHKETGTYSAGQALLNAESPNEVLQRSDNYLLTADRNHESRQAKNFVFVGGLVSAANKIAELQNRNETSCM